jgi:hypothetical protein
MNAREANEELKIENNALGKHVNLSTSYLLAVPSLNVPKAF